MSSFCAAAAFVSLVLSSRVACSTDQLWLCPLRTARMHGECGAGSYLCVCTGKTIFTELGAIMLMPAWQLVVVFHTIAVACRMMDFRNHRRIAFSVSYNSVGWRLLGSTVNMHSTLWPLPCIHTVYVHIWLLVRGHAPTVSIDTVFILVIGY